MPPTQVVILGTGTPNVDPDRSGPAVAIVVNGSAYLVDAGRGVVGQADRAARQGIAALQARKLAIVFLTHLHSDHTAGLADLMLTPWVLERRSPLAVFGPPGTRDMTSHLLQAYEADRRNRLDGAEPINTTGWQVNAHEVDNGVVYADSNVRVIAFRVPHGDWADGTTFGYRFETADRTVVVSGDTRPSEAIVQACGGCDVLVHEVYSAERLGARDSEWQRYHRAAHTSTGDLADLAVRAKPGLLVLYHQLYWGTDDEGLLREVRAHYPGRVVSARDLAVY